MSSAEAIAAVVSDLRHGRVRRGCDDPELFRRALACTELGPVVDVSTIWEERVVKSIKGFYLYEDHPCIAPPWPAALFAWENRYGNVWVQSLVTSDRGPDNEWETAEPIDWSTVAWRMTSLLWGGGRGSDGPCPTWGPAYMVRIAVAADGRPLDFSWLELMRSDFALKNEDLRATAHYENALLCLLQSLNFLNCRNVETVEPRRERHERRRLERIGVKVQVINVFPVTCTSRGGAHGDAGHGVALHPVRGHFAHYGPDYNRGLLFGKLAGKFWIDQHKRGTPEIGVNVNDYRLDT